MVEYSVYVNGKIGVAMSDGRLQNDPLLTTDEVAAYLNVDVVTVRRLITKHELAAYRIASEYRVRLSDLENYLLMQYLPARQQTPRQDDETDLDEAVPE
jgi:excisionase family DNA binding protein